MPRDELASVRPYLDDLADDDETTRMQASTAILLGLENASASTVDRAVDRLFTGLTSGRKSGRVGFSVTLAEVGGADAVADLRAGADRCRGV